VQDRRTWEEAALQDERLLGGVTDSGELTADEPPEPSDARELLARLQGQVDLVDRYAMCSRAVRAATHAR